MDNSPEKYMDRMKECAGKKLKLLLDMLEITKAQGQAIAEDNIDTLQKLIDDKQLKIDSVNKIDEEFDVYFQRLKQVLKVKSLEEVNGSGIKGVKELQEAIRQIMKIMNDIGELEKQNNRKANKLLNDIGGEIMKINQGRKINSAYTPAPMQSPSYFIDKKK